MQETEWFPLFLCPINPGVYKTIHLKTSRARAEGYSNWIAGKGWGYTEKTPEEAAKHKHPSSFQSKQWKGIAK